VEAHYFDAAQAPITYCVVSLFFSKAQKLAKGMELFISMIFSGLVYMNRKRIQLLHFVELKL
jgi:hypothetical protein